MTSWGRACTTTRHLMQTPEQIKDRIMAAFPDAHLEVIANGSPANQPSLLVDHAHARQIAKFLRDNSNFALTTPPTSRGWTGRKSLSKRK